MHRNQRCEAPLTCRLSPCRVRQAELTVERIQREFILRDTTTLSLGEQIAEDTCTEHGVFCCPSCFDMTVSH
jgi:hypothetical protein